MASTKSPRIEIIDALRGFALAGILVCHLVEQYVGAGTPEVHGIAVRTGITDQIIEGFIGIFLRGKFIALFSFLFGLSFFIQMDNGAKKEKGFSIRFLWRLALLLGIGYLHSLFYRGDILTIYAMLGIFLIPFYRLSTTWVLGFATLLFLGLGRYIVYYFSQGAHLFLDINPLDMEASHVIDYYNTIKNGGILDVFQTNRWQGHLDKMNFQYGAFGRGYFTFAFFLVGLYVGRSGFFKRFRETGSITSVNKKNIKKILIYSSLLLIISIAITAGAFLSMGTDFQMQSWPAMIALSGYDLINVAMTFIYIALFAILFDKAKTQKWLIKLAPYGRMALTNYVAQSILGTFFLYGWGLGYLGNITNTYTFGIAIIFIIVQAWISKLWLTHFRYGPLEWLWRSLTFFRMFPIRKKYLNP